MVAKKQLQRGQVWKKKICICFEDLEVGLHLLKFRSSVFQSKNMFQLRNQVLVLPMAWRSLWNTGEGPQVLILVLCVQKTMSFSRFLWQGGDVNPLILARLDLVVGVLSLPTTMARRERLEVGTVYGFPEQREGLRWIYLNCASIVFTWKDMQRENTGV